MFENIVIFCNRQKLYFFIYSNYDFIAMPMIYFLILLGYQFSFVLSNTLFNARYFNCVTFFPFLELNQITHLLRGTKLHPVMSQNSSAYNGIWQLFVTVMFFHTSSRQHLHQYVKGLNLLTLHERSLQHGAVLGIKIFQI